MNRESLITGDNMRKPQEDDGQETNSEIGWRKYMEYLRNKKNMEKKLTEFTDEEEIILNRVFDRYEEKNESVVYQIGLSLMLTMNFMMTAYLVVTVMNN